MKNSENIILFDGVCTFCNRFVQFVIARDPRVKFHLASLQSGFAHYLFERFDSEELERVGALAGAGNDSVVLVTPSGIFGRSSAIARILLGLTGPWPIVGAIFWLIPKPLREFGYRVFAARRHLWFKKLESCPIPPPEQRKRFLGL